MSLLSANIKSKIILPSGTSVLTVAATDIDASSGLHGDHGALVHSIISGDTNNEFQINPATGLVSTAAVLDIDTLATNPYTLTVQVRHGRVYSIKSRK